MAQKVTDKQLDQFITLGMNVLFSGKHGVGKTAMVIDAFNRNGLNWVYFSGSTIDPWVDLVGVPRPVVPADGGTPYLTLVRPKIFVDKKRPVEAIFIDELNRSSKKTRNAIMEAIQFKSINGLHLGQLRVVWAAVNPPNTGDEAGSVDYDVEELDPALADRFHIKIDIPFKPDAAYLYTKHSKGVVDKAIEWWNGLPINVQAMVSPRTLDKTMEVFTIGCNDPELAVDLGFLLPVESGPMVLTKMLTEGPIMDELISLANNGDNAAADVFVKNNPNATNIIVHNFDSSAEFAKFWLPRMLSYTDDLSRIIESDPFALVFSVFNAREIKQPISGIVSSLLKAENHPVSWRAFWCALVPNGVSNPAGGKISLAKTIKNPYRVMLKSMFDVHNLNKLITVDTKQPLANILTTSGGFFSTGKLVAGPALLDSSQQVPAPYAVPVSTKGKRRRSSKPVISPPYDTQDDNLPDLDDDSLTPTTVIANLVDPELINDSTDYDVLYLIAEILNPPPSVPVYTPGYIPNDKVLADLNSWYARILPHVILLSYFEQPISIRGVRVDIIPTIIRAVIFDIAQMGLLDAKAIGAFIGAMIAMHPSHSNRSRVNVPSTSPLESTLYGFLASTDIVNEVKTALMRKLQTETRTSLSMDNGRDVAVETPTEKVVTDLSIVQAITDGAFGDLSCVVPVDLDNLRSMRRLFSGQGKRGRKGRKK